MVEIWVPYGPVEVSFDIKQENLSQILEPHTTKLDRIEIERRITESVSADSILVLASTIGTTEILDALLSKNKSITRIIYPKEHASLARRKSQEFSVPTIEELNLSDLSDAGIVDGKPAKMFTQVKNSTNLVILTSVHYDPLFGVTSAASDLTSLSREAKSEAFRRSIEELPCEPSRSNASWYATRLLQTSPNISVIEVVEKVGSGIQGIFVGEPESTHAKVIEFWNDIFSVPLSSKAERVIFGCGGKDGDRSLTNALGRSFFNVVQNASLKDSGAKVCMLAECSEGLGSEALLRYVTGRFTPGANLDEVSYFDGLEVLLSFYKVQEQLDLSMISTLPKYYGEKFQFKMYSGAREAPSSVVSQGSRAKILVVPDGSATRFNLGL